MLYLCQLLTCRLNKGLKELSTVWLLKQLFCSNVFFHFQLILKPILSTYSMIYFPHYEVQNKHTLSAFTLTLCQILEPNGPTSQNVCPTQIS